MSAADKWLTPDLPVTPLRCRRLLFPDGIDWLSIVNGALLQLTRSNNYEQFGTATPQQTADIFADTFNDFSFEGDRGCRVIGEIIVIAGPLSPDPNWLECDGASLLRSDYPDLFTVIGTIYGSVDSTHFNTPDMRGRVVIDLGSGSGLTPRALGDVGGEEAHTLTVAESASHSHADSGHTHAEGNAAPTAIAIGVGVPAPSAVPTVGITGTGFSALSNSGLDGAHNNMQPFLTLHYLIVAM